MDWDKNIKNIRYDMDRNYRMYEDASSVDERRVHINNFTKIVNYIQKLSQGNVPRLQKDVLTNLL